MSTAVEVSVGEPGCTNGHSFGGLVSCLLIRFSFASASGFTFSRAIRLISRLRQAGGNRLRGVALGKQRTMVAVELDRRGLDSVGILPQTSVALVERDGGRVVRSHGGGGDMNRRSGGQQGAVRLLFEFVVSAFDVSFSKSIVVGTIDTDCAGASDHGALADARVAAEDQNPV